RKFSFCRFPMGWSFSSVTLTCTSVRSTFTFSLKLLSSCARSTAPDSRQIKTRTLIFFITDNKPRGIVTMRHRFTLLYLGGQFFFLTARDVPNWGYYFDGWVEET